MQFVVVNDCCCYRRCFCSVFSDGLDIASLKDMLECSVNLLIQFDCLVRLVTITVGSPIEFMASLIIVLLGRYNYVQVASSCIFAVFKF